jgi:DNA (cytosine-5)-methyltransferase 1
LWESIKRIIGEVGPEWCFFENVSAHLRVGFEQVHDDLCSMGYKVASGLFKATEVGAGHSRERLFLLAHSVSKRRERTVERESICLDETSDSSFSKECTIGRLAHAFDNGGAIMGSEASEYPMDLGFPPRPDSELWRNIGDRFSPAKIIESNILGMANGLAATMDSLRCSGNAVCPLVAAYAFHILQTNFELSPETIKPPI